MRVDNLTVTNIGVVARDLLAQNREAEGGSEKEEEQQTETAPAPVFQVASPPTGR